MTNCDNNIVNLLHQRAIQFPDKVAYAFLKDGITIGSSLTYGELDSKARAIAETIQFQASPGVRALLLYSSSEEFLPAFFGCLYAGVIAVPCPMLEGIGLKQILSRVNAISNDSHPSLLLTTSSCYSGLEERNREIAKLQTLKRIETNQVSQKLAGIWQQPTVNNTNLAYLQYTSGSTSQPKGVCISHNNLMQNLVALHQALGYTTDSIACTWVPYSHDLGLVKGLLEPLYAGIPCYVMSPISFMKRPMRWLQTISHYQVTHSEAPNFAYDYCVSQTTAEQRAKLNLRNWLRAGIGAEPIRQDTVQRFAENFYASGFKRNAFCFTYGLA